MKMNTNDIKKHIKYANIILDSIHEDDKTLHALCLKASNMSEASYEKAKLIGRINGLTLLMLGKFGSIRDLVNTLPMQAETTLRPKMLRAMTEVTAAVTSCNYVESCYLENLNVDDILEYADDMLSSMFEHDEEPSEEAEEEPFECDGDCDNCPAHNSEFEEEDEEDEEEEDIGIKISIRHGLLTEDQEEAFVSRVAELAHEMLGDEDEDVSED